MKKLNNKGFTLIELLAVIVIMVILMMVAIPAIGRTIENSRRSMFANTAGEYASAVETAVMAGELKCKDNGAAEKEISGLTNDKTYYYKFDSTAASGQDLMEKGGKSSWGDAEVQGIVEIKKTGTSTGKTKFEYKVRMVDANGRGIKTAQSVPVGRTKVEATSSSVTSFTLTADEQKYECSLDLE